MRRRRSGMPSFTTKTTIRHANGEKTLMAKSVTVTSEGTPAGIDVAPGAAPEVATEAGPEAGPDTTPQAAPQLEPEVKHSVSEDVVKVAHEGEIGKRLKKAAARVGALTVSLIWDTVDDLDLHAESPASRGETGHIFWNNKKGKCGGHLDVDMNANRKHMMRHHGFRDRASQNRPINFKKCLFFNLTLAIASLLH